MSPVFRYYGDGYFGQMFIENTTLKVHAYVVIVFFEYMTSITNRKQMKYMLIFILCKSIHNILLSFDVELVNFLA